MNPRQQRFVSEYLLTLNATQSAVAAGYSARTAKQMGSRLLTRPNIKAALGRGQVAQLEREHVNAAWLLQRLVELAEVDIADIFTESGWMKPIREIPKAARRLISSIKVKRYLEGEGRDAAPVEVTEVRLLDRLRALENIGKHIAVGAFQPDRAGVNVLLLVTDYTGRAHERKREIDVTPEI